MTFIIGIRCDICGQETSVTYEGQAHKTPEGWGSFDILHGGDGTDQHRDACPECFNALVQGIPVKQMWDNQVVMKVVNTPPVIDSDWTENTYTVGYYPVNDPKPIRVKIGNVISYLPVKGACILREGLQTAIKEATE